MKKELQNKVVVITGAVGGMGRAMTMRFGSAGAKFCLLDLDKNAIDGDGSLTNHPRSSIGKIASPQEVARAIYNGAVAGKRLLVLSRVGKLAYLLSRLAPSLYEKMMVKRLKQELER